MSDWSCSIFTCQSWVDHMQSVQPFVPGQENIADAIPEYRFIDAPNKEDDNGIELQLSIKWNH